MCVSLLEFKPGGTGIANTRSNFKINRSRPRLRFRSRCCPPLPDDKEIEEIEAKTKPCSQSKRHRSQIRTDEELSMTVPPFLESLAHSCTLKIERTFSKSSTLILSFLFLDGEAPAPSPEALYSRDSWSNLSLSAFAFSSHGFLSSAATHVRRVPIRGN